ncbi:hypothetical protein PR048_028759 [Dryococelus australis]|uniref:Uncharacterized protein n=1 Tax=Dryococelus australis TaxID=614101 RepID=A0ABQ9GBH2_9NEOP|nr:hypothetical protein PR048_028759 [Dryococelus australis]
MRKSGSNPAEIKPDSPWWEASRLTAQPSQPSYNALKHHCTREYIRVQKSNSNNHQKNGVACTRNATTPFASQRLVEKVALNIVVLRTDDGETRRVWSSTGMRRQRETGDTRENPPGSGIVRHDSQRAKIRERPPPGMELSSPRWEASSLTTTPPLPLTDRVRNGDAVNTCAAENQRAIKLAVRAASLRFMRAGNGVGSRDAPQSTNDATPRRANAQLVGDHVS